METPADRPRCAWQPLTPRGVAAFADASLGRLLQVQFLVACLVAISLVWFIYGAWFPVVRSAIAGLPDQGRIRSGHLEWGGEPATVLAENRFLALTIDLNHSGTVRSPAHVQVELGTVNWRVSSLFGFVAEDYPTRINVPLNRTELEPWWGAWAPALLAVVTAGTFVGLLVAWTLLSSLYFFAAWLLALLADRQLSLTGSWRLAGAALMPGALVMVAAIFAYGWGMLNLLELIGALAAHLVVGWLYLVLGTRVLPRSLVSPTPTVNPFTPDSTNTASPNGQNTKAPL